MNHRSLLDYLAENYAATDADAQGAAAPVPGFEQRLAEIERKLQSASRAEEPPIEEGAESFSSRIETIVRGRGSRSAGPQEPSSRNRIETRPPALAPDLPAMSPEALAEFNKFVEAVYLVGQAANRFMTPSATRPAVPVGREAPGAVDKDAIRFTLALKDAVATIQSLTADLNQAAANLKQVANGDRQKRVEPPAARQAPREDAELEQLRNDLEDLRHRMGAYNRRKSGERY